MLSTLLTCCWDPACYAKITYFFKVVESTTLKKYELLWLLRNKQDPSNWRWKKFDICHKKKSIQWVRVLFENRSLCSFRVTLSLRNYFALQSSSIGDLVTLFWPFWQYLDFCDNFDPFCTIFDNFDNFRTIFDKGYPWLVTFETVDECDWETWSNQQKDNDSNKGNPGDW